MRKITDWIMLRIYAVRVCAIMAWCLVKSAVLIAFMIFKDGGLDMSKVVMHCSFNDAGSVDVVLYNGKIYS